MTVDKEKQNDHKKAPPPTELFTQSRDRVFKKLETSFKQLYETASQASKAHQSYLKASEQQQQQLKEAAKHPFESPEQLQSLNKLSQAGTSASSGFQAESIKAEDDLDRVGKSTQTGSTQEAAGAKRPVFDEADMVAFAGGKVSTVFGKEYAIVDSYPNRLKLPLPPYLFVSRVTRIKGSRGELKSGFIQTEYDIPEKAWYATNGQVPGGIVLEASQGHILLAAYLGVDFENKGMKLYRLLNSKVKFLGNFPNTGDTLRYDIKINSFVRSGDILLMFFESDCYVGKKIIAKTRDVCGGFFTERQLQNARNKIASYHVEGISGSIGQKNSSGAKKQTKRSFSEKDLDSLEEGKIASCFGPQYDQKGLNPSLCLPSRDIRMVDRIVDIQPDGGKSGLGALLGEKHLSPEHWYFNCHFRGDLCMPGPLIAEGCAQVLQFYMLYLGLQLHTRDAQFQPIQNCEMKAAFRSQLRPESGSLRYRLDITEIGNSPVPYAKADATVIHNGLAIGRLENIGLQLREKEKGTSDTNQSLLSLKPTGNGEPLLNKNQIDQWARGNLAITFGPEYKVFKGRKVPRIPNGDFCLITRAVQFKGLRYDLKRLCSMVTEYDVPADAWYYQQNHSPQMPYSIYMECALQACGCLSGYAGVTLLYPDQEYFFRNLDGKALILRQVDLRGKTVKCSARLFPTTVFGSILIQKFEFELSSEGEPFYQGDAAFGFFNSVSLAKQVGLDNGKHIQAWYENTRYSNADTDNIDLKSSAALEKYYHHGSDRSYYRLAVEQLNFLDELMIISRGGRYQQGYVHARKKINPQEWFFSRHFYQDPVMPGSLGVEAIFQGLQAFAIEQKLGRDFNSPCFCHVLDHQTTWKYRGQIIPENREMSLEIHIKKIESGNERVVVIADASLWKEGLRIYEVSDAAICLCEAPWG